METPVVSIGVWPFLPLQEYHQLLLLLVWTFISPLKPSQYPLAAKLLYLPGLTTPSFVTL
jgi:hypothetical protein